jgi:hypothetical protein
MVEVEKLVQTAEEKKRPMGRTKMRRGSRSMAGQRRRAHRGYREGTALRAPDWERCSEKGSNGIRGETKGWSAFAMPDQQYYHLHSAADGNAEEGRRHVS